MNIIRSRELMYKYQPTTFYLLSNEWRKRTNIHCNTVMSARTRVMMPKSKQINHHLTSIMHLFGYPHLFLLPPIPPLASPLPLTFILPFFLPISLLPPCVPPAAVSMPAPVCLQRPSLNQQRSNPRITSHRWVTESGISPRPTSRNLQYRSRGGTSPRRGGRGRVRRDRENGRDRHRHKCHISSM